MKTNSEVFFLGDGLKVIDYVLVYSKKKLNDHSKVVLLETFVQNLQKIGFDYETHTYTRDFDKRFVLLHLKDDNMVDYVMSFKIDLTMNSVLYKFRKSLLSITETFLTDPDKYNELYARAPETFAGDKPNGFTSAERIYIVKEILNKNRFGEAMNMYGIKSLIKSGCLETAFPVHSGPYEWTVSGPLNDRQLLYEFWARPKRWYKEQPNNVIEKYLGTEQAFYFKWMALYTTMLLIPAVFSIISLIFGIVTVDGKENMLSKELCNKNMLICPLSARDKYFYSNTFCWIFNLTYILNNHATMAFAIIISLWSTILCEMWKRIEATNQMKWNVKHMEQDISMRMEYKERAHYRELTDGTLEPFVPMTSWVLHTSATILTVLLTTILILAVTITMIMVRILFIRVMNDSSSYVVTTIILVLPQFVVNLAISIIMILFQKAYYKISLMITSFEIPRTEMEFDNSYIYKCYILDCINFFASLMFLGFVMGKLIENPSVKTESVFANILYRQCSGLSCTYEMAGLQFTIWIVRFCNKLITKLLIPWLKVKKKRGQNFDKLKQWEEDYLLNTNERYYIAHEYLDAVLEYGFVTFFISSFPLAPLCGFIVNLAYLRMNSYNSITLYRRPNARKVPKLVCFSKLIQATTYFGIVTNAAMIAFNSELATTEMYRSYFNSTLEGISTLVFSKIETRKVFSFYNYKAEEEFCYYKEIRDVHQNKNLNYWWITAIRFAILLGIEHVVFLVQGFLAYMIPDVPYSVKEEVSHQQKLQREQNMRETETSFINNRKKVIKDSERFVLIK